jgi:ribosomal protein S6--L-glutamate ligase
MKIGILSRNAELYSTRRLVEAAEARGHEVQVINPLLCYMNITSLRPTVYLRGKALDDFDAIIPRIGASITFYGTAVVRQFEMMGVYSVNESVAISRSRDKLRSLQLLARAGIGLPVTGFAHSTMYTQDLIDMVGGAPLVVKLLEGTQGVGVVLAETENSGKSVIEAFKGLKANILVQEYIKEARGSDLRCFVIGGRVVASMMRKGKEGEFRSNLHRGGSASTIHAAGAHHGCARGPSNGAQRGGRGHAARQSRAGGDGSKFVAGAGRHRKGHEPRCGPADHRLHREECQARQDADARQGMIGDTVTGCDAFAADSAPAEQYPVGGATPLNGRDN